MISLRNIKAVIFDMDGLLLDTEPMYTQATNEIVALYGKEYDWSVKSLMMGKPALQAAHILIDKLKLPISPETYLQKREIILEQYFVNAQPKPGAQNLTIALSKLNIPLAVATSSTKKSFSLKARNHKEWFSLFQTVITGNNPKIKHGKPAPDIFLIAAAELQILPKDCLVFEDSPTGVQAAKKAGMKVVAVPDPHINIEDVSNADVILDSLIHFFDLSDLQTY